MLSAIPVLRRAFRAMRLLFAAAGVAAVAYYAAPVLDRMVPDGEPAATPVAHAAYGPPRESYKADRYGQYAVQAHVDGTPVAMLADTGASFVILTFEDARRAGFNPGRLTYDRAVSTANGRVMNAYVRIDRLDVGTLSLRDVDALVAPEGALWKSLLGMSFLRRLSSFNVEDRQLTLVQ